MRALISIILVVAGFPFIFSCGGDDRTVDKVYEGKYFVENLSQDDAVFYGKRKSARDFSEIVSLEVQLPKGSIVEVDSDFYSIGHLFPSNIYSSYAIAAGDRRKSLTDDDWDFCSPEKVYDEAQIIEICSTLTGF